MKKFCKNIFLFFILPFALLFLAGEAFLRNVPNDYSYKNAWLTKNAHSVKLINFGSSHAFYGINPELFPVKSFNAAHLSQTLKYDYMILDKFAGDMDSLRYVILPISYFTLFSPGLETDEPWRIKNYRLYYKLNVGGSFRDYVEMYPLPVRQLKTVIFGKEHSLVSVNALGFGLAYDAAHRDPNWEMTGEVAAQRHTYELLDSDAVATNVNYLNKILEICKKKNVEVVLLTTPTWKTYRTHLSERQLALMTGICEKLASENSNVRYVNLLADGRFSAADFFDADHLCDKGAAKLTKIISDTLWRPYASN